MRVVLSAFCVSCLLIANFSLVPQATAQCLTKNDDMSKIPTSTDLSGIVDFHLELFQELIPKDVKTNFIFSAYSVWNALTLAYFGASGRTEEQLRQVLRHDDKLSTLKKCRDLEFLYKRRPETSINNTFILANRAYFDTKIHLRSCMEKILHNEIERIDFTKPQEAADHINAFVSEITKGTIKDLVSANDVDRVPVVLANAAYFKGTWQSTFDKEETQSHPFTGLDNTQYTVDMMVQLGKFRYGRDDEIKAEVIELPYSGKTISMLLLKPFQNSQSDFNSMVQGLSTRKIEEIIAKMASTKIQVKLPKFKLDTTIKDELRQALTRMGLTDPFDQRKADFTAFTVERQSFDLRKSIHKAYIAVNEEGTEASAATAFLPGRSGRPIQHFHCNSPFIFVIRDHETKNLLFMGAYKSPDTKGQSFKPTGGSDRNSAIKSV